MPNYPLRQAPFETLAARCAEETERFFQRQEHDEAPCFELMRRALVERSEAAWEFLYRQYTPLVISWIQEHSQFAACGEDAEYFINESFQRFWRACTAANFDNFPGLRPLLSYLKACVHSTITDHLRTRELQMRLHHPSVDLGVDDFIHPTSIGAADVPVEEQVIDQDHRRLLWKLVQQRVVHDQERAVVYHQFIEGWKPREIVARCNGLFADQQEVYRVRDNLVRRLSCDPELRAYFEESRAV